MSGWTLYAFPWLFALCSGASGAYAQNYITPRAEGDILMSSQLHILQFKFVSEKWDLNPWLPWFQFDALPTELSWLDTNFFKETKFPNEMLSWAIIITCNVLVIWLGVLHTIAFYHPHHLRSKFNLQIYEKWKEEVKALCIEKKFYFEILITLSTFIFTLFCSVAE